MNISAHGALGGRHTHRRKSAQPEKRSAIHSPPVEPCSSLFRQSERENIPSRRDGHVLPSVDQICHGRCTPFLPRIEVPQRLAPSRIDGGETASRLSVEH